MIVRGSRFDIPPQALIPHQAHEDVPRAVAGRDDAIGADHQLRRDGRRWPSLSRAAARSRSSFRDRSSSRPTRTSRRRSSPSPTRPPRASARCRRATSSRRDRCCGRRPGRPDRRCRRRTASSRSDRSASCRAGAAARRSRCGTVQVAPPSLVRIALAPFCAIANQVRRVLAALPVSMKYGYQETPPDGNPARRPSPGVAAVAGLDDAVGLVKPADQMRGIVGIDLQRVEADVEPGFGERLAAVGRLEDGVVAGRPDRRRRRSGDGDDRAARHVRERVVDQRPGVAVVGRLPEPGAAAADIEVARACRIAGDAAGTVDVRVRAKDGGHAGRRDVDPDTRGQVPAATHGSGGSGPTSPPASPGPPLFQPPQAPSSHDARTARQTRRRRAIDRS